MRCESTRSAWPPAPTRSNWGSRPPHRRRRRSRQRGEHAAFRRSRRSSGQARRRSSATSEPEAGTMDVSSLAETLGEKTRAVVPGPPVRTGADTDAIVRLCAERGIDVVEDCAQAAGAQLNGRVAGTIGRLGCFSFYPTKNLAGLGDGGAVVTDDDSVADRLRRLRQYGQIRPLPPRRAGCEQPPRRAPGSDPASASSPPRAMEHAPCRDRRGVHGSARRVPGQPVGSAPESPPRVPPLRGPRHPTASALQRHLEAAGVQTLIHYPSRSTLHPPYRRLAERPVSLAVSEWLCARHPQPPAVSGAG